MEYLTIMMDMEYFKDNISPIYQVEPLITHLPHTDDILILTKATMDNAECIKHIFQILENHTGLDLNYNKYTMFFSKGAKNKHQIANTLKISTGNLPFMYLGIALSSNKSKARDFDWSIDKINKKFNHEKINKKFNYWNSKMVNISGRISNDCHLSNDPFWLQFTQFPISIIQKINSLYVNFIWKSKAHKMSWDDVRKTKLRVDLVLRE